MAKDDLTYLRHMLDAARKVEQFHGYFDVDLDIVWAIVEKDLPDLSVKLNDLILSLGHKEE
jgi:uncharacterized protein with HEPN domain